MKKWALIGCVVVFLLLSFTSLLNREVWFDELASINVAHRDYQNLIETATRDTHPPLYFLILKIWLTISDNFYFLRLLSLMIGSGTIIVMFKFTQKLLPTNAAQIATFLLSISPLHIYYATEIRMYALFLFEILLLTFWFLKFVNDTSTKNSFIIFFIELVSLYTHYYSGLIIIALTVWLWIYKRPKFRSWLMIQLFAGLTFLPWLIYAWQFSKPACWCFSPVIGLPALFSALTVGGVGIVTLKDIIFHGPIILIFLLLSTSLRLFILFIYRFIKRRSDSSLITYCFFIPLILILPISFFIPVFSPRAFIFLLPYFLIFVSQGISFGNHTKLKFMSVVILLTLTSLLQGIHPFFTRIPIYKRHLEIEKLEIFRK